MNERLDQLLQEHFVYDGPSKLRYEALTEAQKLELSKGLMNSVISMVFNKGKNLDYELIEKSKGSIRKVEGYADLVGSINGLKALQQSSRRNIEGVNTVDVALTNLQNLEDYFVKAYAIDCTIIKVLYNNAVLALIASVANLISTSVDLIKTDAGLVHMTASVNTSKALENNMLKSLESFNKLCLNGDIQKFVNKVLPSQHLSGDLLGLVSIPILAFVAIAIAVMIRQIVYTFYNMRVKVSDYLRVNAEFLELNSSKMNAVNDMKGTARKQQEAARNLISLADKIDVDQKVASKKANIDIKQENSHQTGTYDTAAPDDLLF